MVYVQRDAEGRLLRVEHDPFEGMTETLAVESEELDKLSNRWSQRSRDSAKSLSFLTASTIASRRCGSSWSR